ncbi:hypothetical protein B0J18DRAFT_415529 [Chaetomium sp. MPI-SDFR-AT-0129]|nr:hypothetical protein B0J18DRAFT_415529 [Chaetomium sp. MPI-SDFR-AT-0129]
MGQGRATKGGVDRQGIFFFDFLFFTWLFWSSTKAASWRARSIICKVLANTYRFPALLTLKCRLSRLGCLEDNPSFSLMIITGVLSPSILQS